MRQPTDSNSNGSGSRRVRLDAQGGVTGLRRPPLRSAVLILVFSIAASTIVTISAAAQLKPPDSPIPPSFFGLHIHRGGGIPWPVVPFGTWRLWDANVVWPWLEPKKGDWHFEGLDALVTL